MKIDHANIFTPSFLPEFTVGECQHAHTVPAFTCLGIILSIICFPCGYMCCWLLAEKKCGDCGKKV